eukprot:5920580-Amphidinium_carterae.1
MALGGARGHVEAVRPGPVNDAQRKAVAGLAELAQHWVELDSDPLSLDVLLSSPVLSAEAYNSQGSITVAFPLVASQLVGALPTPGQAAQVDIRSLVSPSTRAWLDDPRLVLLPPSEFPDPLPRAKVLVDSSSEFDRVIAECFARGLVEPTTSSATFHVRGRPLFNGMFGVHKKFVAHADGTQSRVLRLIANLIPSNSLLKPMTGCSQQMGYSPLWAQLHLEDGECLLLYSEDQQSCFHLYSMPPSWRCFFVIGHAVNPSVFGLGPQSQPIYPRLTVVPMGWGLSVDLIQEAHQELLRRASLVAPSVHEDRLIRLQRLFPRFSGDFGGHYHSCYVDNWDQMVVTCKSVAALGVPSEGQVAVRSAYSEAGVVRDPQKAVQGSLELTSLGTSLDGLRGTAGVTVAKRREVVLLVHIFQFGRPLLSILESSFRFCEQFQHAAPLSVEVADEILAAVLMLPLAEANLRAPFCPLVTCSDASPTGGGSC